jgi:hypothetical protein
MADFGKLQGFLMLFQVIGGFLGTLVTGRRWQWGNADCLLEILY